MCIYNADDAFSATLLTMKSKPYYRTTMLDEIKKDFVDLFSASSVQAYIVLQEPKSNDCIVLTHRIDKRTVLDCQVEAISQRVLKQHLRPCARRLLLSSTSKLLRAFGNDESKVWDFVLNSLPSVSVDGHSNLVITLANTAREAAKRGSDVDTVFSHCKRSLSTLPVRAERATTEGLTSDMNRPSKRFRCFFLIKFIENYL